MSKNMLKVNWQDLVADKELNSRVQEFKTNVESLTEANKEKLLVNIYRETNSLKQMHQFKRAVEELP